MEWLYKHIFQIYAGILCEITTDFVQINIISTKHAKPHMPLKQTAFTYATILFRELSFLYVFPEGRYTALLGNKNLREIQESYKS